MSNAMTMPAHHWTTSRLWTHAHSALANGRYYEALDSLYILSGRSDCNDSFCDLEAYERNAGESCPEEIRLSLNERLLLIGANVRNRDICNQAMGRY